MEKNGKPYIFKTYKKFLHSIAKDSHNLTKNWAKDLNKYFSKEYIHKTGKQVWEKMLNAIIRKMKIKSTIRYYPTPVRMAITKKSKDVEKFVLLHHS
jgi:hypothetical protein